MTVSNRVLEVAQLMVSEESAGRPITLDHIADLLQQRDGVSIGNSTYVKAKSVYRKLTLNPILLNKNLMAEIGVIAASRLLVEMPAADAAGEILSKSVEMHGAINKKIQGVYESSLGAENALTEIARVIGYLEERQATKAANVLKDAALQIENFIKLVKALK